ncbi:unnamed protein product [Amoebophrya sp. A25]|nr:unnamed protein product [Amoebophrya sp. A25]|eukprot:GSA25T00021028001.1
MTNLSSEDPCPSQLCCWIRSAYRLHDNPVLHEYRKACTSGTSSPGTNTTLILDTHKLEHDLAKKVFGATDVGTLRCDFVDRGVDEFVRKLSASGRQEGHHVRRFGFEVEPILASLDASSSPSEVIEFEFDGGATDSEQPVIWPDSGKLRALTCEVTGRLAGLVLKRIFSPPGSCGDGARRTAQQLFFDRLHDPHNMREESVALGNLRQQLQGGSSGIVTTGIGCHNLIRDMDEYLAKVDGLLVDSCQNNGETCLRLDRLPLGFGPFVKVLHRNWDSLCPEPVEDVLDVVNASRSSRNRLESSEDNKSEEKSTQGSGDNDGSTSTARATDVKQTKQGRWGRRKKPIGGGEGEVQPAATDAGAAASIATTKSPIEQARRPLPAEAAATTIAAPLFSSTERVPAVMVRFKRSTTTKNVKSDAASANGDNASLLYFKIRLVERDNTVETNGPTPSAFTHFPPGEDAGLEKFRKNVVSREDWVRKFKKPLTNPMALEPATSGLSPYLANGFLSVRTVAQWLRRQQMMDEQVSSQQAVAEGGFSPAARGNGWQTIKLKEPPTQQSLLGQLCWREFAHFLGFAIGPGFDTMIANPFCLRYQNWKQIDRETAATYFLATTRRRTGTGEVEDTTSEVLEVTTAATSAGRATPVLPPPAVLAGIGQLRTTGWIHHIMRHMLACFITRGCLRLHWEVGRDFFHAHLLDYDWAINASQWQWLSCSMLFYAFNRVYHPIGFAKKWDRSGGFLRHWVEEGSSMKNGTASSKMEDFDACAAKGIESLKAAFLGSSAAKQNPLFYAAISQQACDEWKKEDPEFASKLTQRRKEALEILRKDPSHAFIISKIPR